MNRRLVLQINVVASVLFLCACGSGEEETQKIPSVSLSKEKVKLNPSVAELKRLYKAAQSQYERRAVSFRAIDERSIKKGGQVAAVDAIFGTQFASVLPGNGSMQLAVIHFGPKIAPPPGYDGPPVAIGYIGWSLEIEYDHDGKIQNYHLSNLWKRHPSYEEGIRGRTPIPQLRRQYETARTEDERRAVCIKAIDEVAVSTYRPVSTVDAIFGTHLASQLPTKKEAIRTGIVELAPSTQTESPEKDRARTSHGWFLAVEYEHDGNITDYYLTNVRK